MHPLLILKVSNKKFAHIFQGNSIPTQPRRSVSRDSHLDLRLQPATGSASASLASPACRMDPASALRSLSSRCCRIAYCFQLVPHTNDSSTVLPGPRKQIGHVWSVSRTYPIQLIVPTRDRAPGGISSEDFPSYTRSAFSLNALARSLSHGEVPRHRRSAFPSISQELTRNANRKSRTPVTVNSPTAKRPMVRPQRYTIYPCCQFSVPGT